MDQYRPYVDTIAAEQAAMRQCVVDWASINTGTRNLAGLRTLADRLSDFISEHFDVAPQRLDLKPESVIDARGESRQIPLGQALSFAIRPEAPLRVFCCIHMDTVYGPDHPFQQVTELDPDRIKGPGVTDAKGGLVVMLHALRAFEQTPWHDRVGYEVLINPDEEIGSPGSSPLLSAAAKRNHLGLLFEPALPDGSLVDRRRGSGNFTIVIHGKSAHAGRDFASGRSALLAAAELTLRLHALNSQLGGVTVNIGAIDGGGPVNVVPDLAIVRLNVRTTAKADEERVLFSLHHLVGEYDLKHGLRASLHGHFASPPKLITAGTTALLQNITATGRHLGLQLTAGPSGGVSDGNKLAAAGLTNIDTLGVRGGSIHSPEEFLIVSREINWRFA
jgi:glutamate carboxypeptidase